MSLLTDEQKAQLKQLYARRAAKNVLEQMFAGLNLSAQQKEQIVSIVAVERGKISEQPSPQEIRQMMQNIRKRIAAEVLTDQQRNILAQRLKDRRGAQSQPGE